MMLLLTKITMINKQLNIKNAEGGNNGIPKGDAPQCGEMSRSDRGDGAVSLKPFGKEVYEGEQSSP